MIEYAFTVRPPWSWAIAEAQTLTAINIAPKLVENRARPIAPKHFGTRVAVHAGVTWSKEGCGDLRVRFAWDQFRRAFNLTAPNPLLVQHGDRRSGLVGELGPGNMWIDTGAVVAAATVVGCHRADILPGPPEPEEACCPPWGDLYYNGGNAWHIELADVVRLPKPVPAVGRISVPWRLPDDVAAVVQAELDKAAR